MNLVWITWCEIISRRYRRSFRRLTQMSAKSAGKKNINGQEHLRKINGARLFHRDRLPADINLYRLSCKLFEKEENKRRTFSCKQVPRLGERRFQHVGHECGTIDVT